MAKIVVQEAVQKGQTDMKPVLTAVAAAGPEVIYYPIFTAEGGFMTAQSKEVAGLENVVLIGSDGMFSADFVKAAGPAAAMDMYLSSPNFSAFQAGYADLLAKYEAKFGIKPPQAFHAHGYDATNILLNAIETGRGRGRGRHRSTCPRAPSATPSTRPPTTRA